MNTDALWLILAVLCISLFTAYHFKTQLDNDREIERQSEINFTTHCNMSTTCIDIIMQTRSNGSKSIEYRTERRCFEVCT